MTTHLAAPVTHPAAPVTTHASSLRPRAPPPPRHPESILGWLPSRKETQGGRGKSAPAGDWARTRRAPRENGGDAAVTPASPHLSPPRTQPRRREQLLSPLSRFILGATYWPPQSAESPGLLERLQTKPQKGSTLAGSGARRSRGGRARGVAWRGLSAPDSAAAQSGPPPPPPPPPSQAGLALPGGRNRLSPDPVTRPPPAAVSPEIACSRDSPHSVPPSLPGPRTPGSCSRSRRSPAQCPGHIPSLLLHARPASSPHRAVRRLRRNNGGENAL